MITHTANALIKLILIKVFKFEPFLLAAVVFYGVFFWFGSKTNRIRADTWFVSRFFPFFDLTAARLSPADVGCALGVRLVPKKNKN